MRVQAAKEGRHPIVLCPEPSPELARRLERQGIDAKVWVHDEMMNAMTHRDGDTTAMIEDALNDGTNLVGELAAEIARDYGLSQDWLAQLERDEPQPTHSRCPSVYERILGMIVRRAARLADASYNAARRPSAG